MFDFAGERDINKILNKAEKLAFEGKVDKAISYLEKSLTNTKEDFELLCKIGKLYFHRNGFKEACTYFKRAHSVNPSLDTKLLDFVEGLHFEHNRPVESSQFLFEIYTGKKKFEEAQRILDSLTEKDIDKMAERYGTMYENLYKYKEREITKKDIVTHYYLAFVYVMQKKYLEMNNILTKILELNPKELDFILPELERIAKAEWGSAEIVLILGDLYLKKDDISEAVKSYRKAVELDGGLSIHVISKLEGVPEEKRDSKLVMEVLAELYISGKKFDMAMDLLERLKKLGTKLEDIIKLYREILREDNSVVRAHLSLGDFYFEAKRNDLAFQEYSRISDIKPEMGEEVIKRYEMVFKEDPANVLGMTLLVDAYMSSSQIGEATRLLRSAYEANHALSEDIIPRLTDILQKDEDNISALHLLGIIYKNKDEIDKTLTLFNHLANLNPEGAEKVIDELNDIVKSDPNQFEAQLVNADAEAMVKKNKDAVQHYGKVLKSNFEFARRIMPKLDLIVKENPNLLSDIVKVYESIPDFDQFIINYALGEAYSAGGQYEKAAENFRKCMEIAPDKFEVVMDGYKRLIERNETSIPARFAIADALIDRDKIDEATQHLSRIPEIDPKSRRVVLDKLYELKKKSEKNLEVRTAIVEQLHQDKLWNQVIEESESVINLFPSDQIGYFQLRLGEAYQEKGLLTKSAVPLLKAASSNKSLALKAVDILKVLKEIDSSNISSLYALAKVYYLAGMVDESVDEFHNITNVDHKKIPRVIDELKGITSSEPRNVKAPYTLGKLLFNTGEIQLGIEEFEKCISLDLNYVDKVIGDYEKILKEKTDEPHLLLSLGRMFIKKGFFPHAAENLSRALELKTGLREPVIREFKRILDSDPTSSDVRYALAELYLKEKRIKSVVETLSEIVSIKKDEIPKVIEKYKEILQSDSKSIFCLYSLGDAYFKKDDVEKACDTYNLILAIDGSELDKVRSKMKTLLEENPQNAYSTSKYIEVLIKKGMMGEAVSSLERLVFLDYDYIDRAINNLCAIRRFEPKEDSLYLLLGKLYLEKGDYAHAEEAFLSGIKDTKDKELLFNLHINLSHAYTISGNSKGAADELEKAKKLTEEKGRVFKEMENLHIQQIDLNINKTRKFLKQQPDDDNYKIILASLLRRKGEIDGAIELLKFFPKDEILKKKRANQLALCLYQKGDISTSIEILRGFKMDGSVTSEDKEILYNLGRFYYYTGELSQSLACFLRLTRVDPEYKGVNALTKRVYEEYVIKGLEWKPRTIKPISKRSEGG